MTGIIKIAAFICAITTTVAQQVILERMDHLRNADAREWSEFSNEASKALKISFSMKQNTSDHVMQLRQYDVKLQWSISVNGRKVGSLIQDEKDLTTYIALPKSLLHQGINDLLIQCDEKQSDDILVGQVILHEKSVADLMNAMVHLSVLDDSGSVLPSKITILNEKRSLQTLQVDTDQVAAVRAGNVYIASPTSIRLPPGNYTLYATRGFEYGVDSIQVNLIAGQKFSTQFHLTREVDTRGWISCDTHVHTNTYSHHGDATVWERLLSIAGEGIELPVMTDHNINVDISDTLRSLETKLKSSVVSRSFTSVTGDEVTTSLGHFNVFQTDPTKKVIDHTVQSWNDVAKNIKAAGPKVVILNHARDVHNDFIPFAPSRHIATAGMDANNWIFPANAMEVVNSGSQQSDPMQLFHDWFGMLNGGHQLTPVGSSDSHDVSRFLVGQGRTYIRADDSNPGHINVGRAIDQFMAGRVMVSDGLLTKIIVDDQYGPGDLAAAHKQMKVAVEVWGPRWIGANHVVLYLNGKEIKQATIDSQIRSPLKWSTTWTIDVPSHDIFLAAIATGPATNIPFWPLAKPFQPTSQEWIPRVIGASGAVWIDGDGNGTKNSAKDYADVLLKEANGNWSLLIKRLNGYDASVAVQAAAVMWKGGKDLKSKEVRDALKNATVEVREGFEAVGKQVGNGEFR